MDERRHPEHRQAASPAAIGSTARSAVGTDARATIAAQAAERFYRALPGSAPSRVRTRIAVADGAAAEWLPQDTILFDRCCARPAIAGGPGGRARRSLASRRWCSDARLWAKSWIRLGCAMPSASVAVAGWCSPMRSVWTVMSNALLRRPAIARRCKGDGDAVVRCAGTPQAASGIAAVAFVAGTRRPSAGASAWDGLLVVRILAPDAAPLRRRVVAALRALRWRPVRCPRVG